MNSTGSVNNKKFNNKNKEENEFSNICYSTDDFNRNSLEKNPNMDIEELIKKTTPKPKLLKEKLLRKMTWGTLTGLLALVLIGVGTWMGYVGGSNPDDLAFLAFWGCILLAVSISCFISYFVGKKMLAKEIEAEEKQLTTQA